MEIQVRKTEFAEIAPLRELYRAEANCQIVCDSLLGRGLADPYLILVDGRVAGYGGVRNRYDPGQLMEFFVVPRLRAAVLPIFRALLETSGATRIEAQTNMPLMLQMVFDCAQNVRADRVIFADAGPTALRCPDGELRKVAPEDADRLFAHHSEPPGEWTIEVDGEAVATGGALFHYNPPYGDIYMEVSEPFRGRGYGSYLVQELKRICYERGKRPTARCNIENTASRRTLEKAGLLPCGHMLIGDLAG